MMLPLQGSTGEAGAPGPDGEDGRNVSTLYIKNLIP